MKHPIPHIAILFSLVVIAAVLPFWVVIHSAGNAWQGVVPPGYVYDSEFYTVRMVKGTQVFPFGNNPFIMERSKEFNPALSIADYLAAIPLKFGMPLLATLVFNTIFWNLIFAVFLCLFLKNLGIAERWVLYLFPFIYISVYGMLIRPVVLQIVLPFFIFLLFGLTRWLKNQTRGNTLVLAAGIAGTLYIYPYTWQISLLMVGLYFIWSLMRHQWARAWSMARAVLIAFLLASPALWYLYKITSNPSFPQFLIDIGSIKTHMPSMVSFQLARWVVLNIVLWQLITRWVPKLREDMHFSRTKMYAILHGLAIFILAMSPLITGRDGAIGDHLGRELFFWLTISMSAMVYFLSSRGDFSQLRGYKRALILLLVMANIVPVFKQDKRSILQPFQASANEVIVVQDYAKPLAWLEKYDKNPSVVWASPSIGGFVPILSKNFILEVSDLPYQYWNSKSEIQERYLISKYFYDVTPASLDRDAIVPLGHRYVRQFDDLQWKADVCKMLNPIMLGGCVPRSLGMTSSELLVQKNKEIAELVIKNEKEIRPHIAELLKKYQVTYAIKDTRDDSDFHVEKFKNTQEIYNDGRFVIYRFF